MTEDTAQDAAQPGRPWWRANLPTAVAGSVSALTLTLTVSLLATSPADASPDPAPIVPRAATTADLSPVADLAPAAAARPWQVVGHRGGVVWGPEHTRATFDHALQAGADAVEFDVRFTRDEVPVVFHDADLERTTDCAGRVDTITFAELRRCDSGSWFGPPFRGSRVLTLDEVLRQLGARPTLQYYVHMKQYGQPRTAAVVAALRRHGRNDDRTTVLCNSGVCLARFAAAGAARVGYMFTTEAGWATTHPVLVPYNLALRPAPIRAAQQRGQLVLAVEGHPVSVRDLIALGLDGVIANDLDAALRERPFFRGVSGTEFTK